MIESWTYDEITFCFIKKAQLPEVVEVLHQPETEKYLWFAPITVETLTGYAEPIIDGQEKALEAGKYPHSAIFVISKQSELLGTCGIAEMQDAHNCGLIGYQLKLSAWGKGNGTRSLEFLIHYAKTYLNYRKLFGDCVTENRASSRVMEKCCFQFEGVIKEKYELAGKLQDNSWFGLNLCDAATLPDGTVIPESTKPEE